MKFSRRTEWDLTENDFTRAVNATKAARQDLIDLTATNPTAVGLAIDTASTLSPLSAPGAATYRPEPFGMHTAREAVARYYLEHKAHVPLDRICLTTSTSEAYSFLFRLLCDPGDEVLIARPSYPLFDFIARLDGVLLREYPLHYADGWHIDFHALEQKITPQTRAVIVVHPNNPTGNYTSSAEMPALQMLCASRDLALIVDEVFLDYSLDGEDRISFAAHDRQALTFVLSGISKVCALPQMKISWIAVCGPEHLTRKAIARLEVVADTFLSVPAPTQHALPVWLSQCPSIQDAIRARSWENLRTLDELLARSRMSQLALSGGWHAVLRVPHEGGGKDFPMRALDYGVIVQPGEFYGLKSNHVVVSLLTQPDVWRRGLTVLEHLAH